MRTNNALLRLGMESPVLGLRALALGALREQSPLKSKNRVMKLPVIGPAIGPTKVLAAKMEMAMPRSTGSNMSATIPDTYHRPR